MAVNEPLEVLNQVFARGEQAPVLDHAGLEPGVHRLDEGIVLHADLLVEGDHVRDRLLVDVLAEEVIVCSERAALVDRDPGAADLGESRVFGALAGGGGTNSGTN